MHTKLPSAIALLAALAGLILAATALAADAGSQTGGTPAQDPPAIEGSGGVAGPERAPEARRSQQPAQQEEPPQVETTPEEPGPDEEEETRTAPDEAPTTPDDDDAAAAPGSGSGGGSGGGLPTTGLEIGALTAVGLGLLLAGVALRRRPAA